MYIQLTVCIYKIDLLGRNPKTPKSLCSEKISFPFLKSEINKFSKNRKNLRTKNENKKFQFSEFLYFLLSKSKRVILRDLNFLKSHNTIHTLLKIASKR